VEAADTARLQAMLTAFDDGVYADGDGDATAGDGDVENISPGAAGETGTGGGGGFVFPGDTEEDGVKVKLTAAAAAASAAAKPQRMHADRQTTRPLGEQVAEWAGTVPHIRVRGRSALPGNENALLEGVQVIPMEPAADGVHTAGNTPAAAAAAAGPWLAALEGPVEEWWGRADDASELSVTGRAYGSRAAAPPPSPEDAAEDAETFAADGTIEEVYATDNNGASGVAAALDLDGESGGGGGSGGGGSGLAGVLDARRGARRRHLGRDLHSSTLRLNVSAFCRLGGAFRGCLGGFREYTGVFRVYSVSETAQVELKKWTSVSPCTWACRRWTPWRSSPWMARSSAARSRPG